MSGAGHDTVRGQGAGDDRWGDLRPRIASAAVLAAGGVILALASGVWFGLLISALAAVAFWELVQMLAEVPAARLDRAGRGSRQFLAVLAGASVFAAALVPGTAPWAFAFPLLAALVRIAPRYRAAFVAYALGLLLVGFVLIVLRAQTGLGVLLWLVGVVVVSDVAGYFAGRHFGGRKFWPRISPKKTWSGTIAGWVGAVVVGIIAAACGVGGWALVIVSPLVAFAGQMGDIAESWLKRRVGVKDSSALIPGHGGFMDRFDALSGATLMAGLLDLLGWLPISA